MTSSKRGRGEDLAHAELAEHAEHGAEQVVTADHDPADGTEHGERARPAGQARDPGLFGPVPADRVPRAWPVASSGRSASIGMTAMSWKSRTEKALCPEVVLQEVLLREGLQHDGGRRERERHADGDRRLPGKAEREPAAREDGRRGRDLESAEPEDRSAHPPQQRRLELEPDDEQHHDDAELGEVHHVRALRPDQTETPRPDDDAGEEVSEDGPEPEALGEGHRDDRRGEVDEGLDEEALGAHRALPGSASSSAHSLHDRVEVLHARERLGVGQGEVVGEAVEKNGRYRPAA